MRKRTLKYIILKCIVKINGIYDILCALCILRIIYIPYLNDLHLSMMKDYSPLATNQIHTHSTHLTHLFERFLSYWVFTYGVIRLSNSYYIVSYSYYIEAFFFMNEYIHKTVHADKVFFVVGSSFLLGYLVHTHLTS